MTKFMSHMYTRPAVEGLVYWHAVWCGCDWCEEVFSGVQEVRLVLVIVPSTETWVVDNISNWVYFRKESGLILGLCPANERWHYFVTMSLIGWVQA